jgi:hypothetical protein
MSRNGKGRKRIEQPFAEVVLAGLTSCLLSKDAVGEFSQSNCL